MTDITTYTHETAEDFLEAEHDDNLLISAGGAEWLGWQTEYGEWYFVRPLDDSDGTGPERDPYRPVGPDHLDRMPFPMVVIHTSEALRDGR